MASNSRERIPLVRNSEACSRDYHATFRDIKQSLRKHSPLCLHSIFVPRQSSDLLSVPKFRMVNSRAKSCDHCRTAKTRCSLSVPCSRCAKRQLECHYSLTPIHPPKYRWRESLRPILPLTSLTRAVEGDLDTDDAQENRWISLAQPRARPASQGPSNVMDSNPADETFVDVVSLVNTSVEIPDVAIYQDNIPSLYNIHGNSNASHPATLPSESARASDNVPVYPFFEESVSFLYPPSSFPTITLQLDNTSSSAFPGTEFVDLDLLMPTGSTNFTPKPHLSVRIRSLQQGSLTAKMLLSQVVKYTHLLAEGKDLPPFIHPPCRLSPDYECQPDTVHSCLPENLSICTNLTRMFYSRTPASSNFILQQIHTHLRQMHLEVSDHSRPVAINVLRPFTSMRITMISICYRLCKRPSSMAYCVLNVRNL